MRSLRILPVLFALSFSSIANADVAVLVHGYLGNSNTWEQSGINYALEQSGWHRAGIYYGSGSGPMLYAHQDSDKPNKVYTLDLPSTAPVQVQSVILSQILNDIANRHAGEDIIIVGHSAGGVVARMSLVTGKHAQVSALITIASPHLGTIRAAQGLDFADDGMPFDIIKRILANEEYHTLRSSRQLLADLLPPRPGTMLYWLNAQPHPDIDYISIIRTDPVGLPGDRIVPGISQDMNNVPALKDRSVIYSTPAPHTVSHLDAYPLIGILSDMADDEEEKAGEGKKQDG